MDFRGGKGHAFKQTLEGNGSEMQDAANREKLLLVCWELMRNMSLRNFMVCIFPMNYFYLMMKFLGWPESSFVIILSLDIWEPTS